MPELPEVEVTRRSIASRLRGARVLSVRLGKPLRWPLGIAPDALIGSRLGEVGRRGKYLWLPLRRDDQIDRAVAVEVGPQLHQEEFVTKVRQVLQGLEDVAVVEEV